MDGQSDKQALPAGWPEGVSLPTIQEAEEAVRKGEKWLAEELKDKENKLRPLSGEDLYKVGVDFINTHLFYIKQVLDL